MTLTNGLVVMTPSSISYSGTSASINADGSVDFSAVTSLSLNGVFTSNYDNYMVNLRYTNTTSAAAIYFRLRSSGTDQSTGGYYTQQYVNSDRTYIAAQRFTSQDRGRIGNTGYPMQNGDTLYLYGPYLAQPTATRNVSGGSQFDAYLLDFTCIHSLSNSYDGVTFIPDTPTAVNGLLTVFGFNQ